MRTIAYCSNHPIYSIGEGTIHSEPNNFGGEFDRIEVDTRILVQTLDELINFTMPDFTASTIRNHVILAPTNKDVDRINDIVLARMPGKVHSFYSTDTAVEAGEGSADVPVEYLNKISVSGIPPHQLNLKVNCPIMLLRNINPKDGLCNGTRLIVKRMFKYSLDCEIVTGKNAGKSASIMRMPMSPSDTRMSFQCSRYTFAVLPFTLRRLTFPVKPCFSMTINKSQSQTMLRVGLYLPRNVFSHGQLYVAFSRVGRMDALRVSFQMTKTMLIVRCA
jgi:ATP-dependent DNA helicase PIF1